MARRVAWKREHKASYSRSSDDPPTQQPSKGNSLAPEHYQLQRPQQALFPGVIKVSPSERATLHSAHRN
ncbi:hypothetical protein IQ07DRAFT_588918 [Pyrenochaeta sp. DS3sAY3a]|nr:hypothetical protein IQ07DRAFT_588918 [Pyrenochaeta sp. DS3sAY3a]